MFGKLFAKKPKVEPTFIIARLNARVMPVDRGELYEDPLMEVLSKKRVGEVTGGGTQLGKDNEIAFCDIEIQIQGPAEQSVDLLKTTLESLGAPKGSKLLLEAEAKELPFGLNEGLAVYLNGTDLPATVYQECDSNFVYSEFNRLLGQEGSIQSHWQGPTETALYMYGRSFDKMKNCLQDFLNTYPLCQKARVEQIA